MYLHFYILPRLLTVVMAQTQPEPQLRPCTCQTVLLAHCGLAAAWVDPDCAVITPTDSNPVSSRATGLTMINPRIMPYCIIMLDGNVACMMGAASGFSGYYSAINPQLQVDLLNTTATPLRFVTGELPSTGAPQVAATGGWHVLHRSFFGSNCPVWRCLGLLL